MNFIYLHGFASGPDSFKARFFAEAFEKRGLTLERPDLNVGDFTRLTIRGQLDILQSLIDRATTANRAGGDSAGAETETAEDFTLIGSSLGGYVSLLYAQTDTRVKRLILLAPATGFHRIIQKKAGPEGMKIWKKHGYIPVEHHYWKRNLPLHYDLYREARSLSKRDLSRALPIQIFHGLSDDSVPWKNSVGLVERNPLAQLVLLPSDHSLNSHLPLIENQMFAWLGR